MQVYTTIQELQEALNALRKKGKAIAFVPTMGALHQGHLQLIERAKAAQEQVLCSIFVNPTQFNDPQDLEKYPRPIEGDLKALASKSCSLVFLPEVEEIYPPEGLPLFQPQLDGLDTIWEGKARPGHFAGMVQVVKRLLDITQPDSLYMGQKDFQQYSIVKKMLQGLEQAPRIYCVPTVREGKGLALSSRNAQLSAAGREKAHALAQLLFKLPEALANEPLVQVLSKAKASLRAQGFEVDYFGIADRESLRPIKKLNSPAVALAAVRLESVRLIDNVLLDPLY